MARSRKIVLRTSEALFCRTLDGPPTPWIRTSHVDPADGREIELKYRLWVRRRGHSLHVQMHQDSPECPGEVKAMPLSRLRFFELHNAAMALVHCARWDPVRPAQYPRAIWNENARGHELRLEHARVVSSNLLRFLRPQVGRPRSTDYRVTSAVNPNMPVALRGGGRAAARRARRNDLLVLTERIACLIEPMVERMSDSRRMGGYIGAEQQRLYQMVQIVRLSNRTLRDAVFFDKIIESETVPVTNRMDPSSVLVRGAVPEGFTLDPTDMQLPDTPAIAAPTQTFITEEEIDAAMAALDKDALAEVAALASGLRERDPTNDNPIKDWKQ